MARIGTVLSFVREVVNGVAFINVTSDRGQGDNVTSESFGSLGDDSPPLAGDYNILVQSVGSGKQAVVGYIDPNNEGVAAAGEKRIYSRDPNGDVVAAVWLKADGTVALTNDNGGIELKADGTVVINGIEFTTTSTIKGAAGVESGGMELTLHTHTSTAPGSPTGPVITGPPIP